jgi:TRAP-type C4-dicarboxylate transport system permease large subunit
MAIKINERYFGFLGLFGFAGFIPGNSVYYMFFMLFFFFVFARPKTREGSVLSDERWGTNVTKACRNAFFVLLIPSMISVAFLNGTDVFMLAFEVIPVAALLSFVGFFAYYDWRGD